jgi:formylglycine-generating enzyme required for sulfatase activity/predicted Ser/Thr protein kinase
MPVNFLCPNPECTASYSVADENLGKMGRCKKCGTKFALVPDTRVESPGAKADLDSFPRPVDASEEPVPASIGRYKVLKRLGRGGMGTVYLARDPKLEREVALKVPHPEQSRDAASRERFLREARAVAKFHHVNFCPIFDIDETDGTAFLVMAYIKGRSMDRTIEAGVPWNPRKAASVVRQLALALAEAHRQGIVHRDLKPANVMVDAKGQLILMDFGLARRFDSADPTFTAAGSILGTPAYMPPEQAEGDLKAIGPRSDIYSLGVILYELLSGRRPFEGAATRVLAQILMTDPLPPSTHYKNIDASLETICLKAMAKKPEDRFASMDQFAGALQAWHDGAAKPAPKETEKVPSKVKQEAPVKMNEAMFFEAVKPPPVEPAPPADSDPPTPFLKRLGAWFRRLLIRVAIIGACLGLVALVVVVAMRSVESETTNTIGMKLKLIPAGEFQMGAGPGEPQAGLDEKPHHRVRITRPFYLGIYEVTQEEYQKVMGMNPSAFSSEGTPKKGARITGGSIFAFQRAAAPQGTSKKGAVGMDTSRHPVERVSWLDAITFCNNLSEREGLKPCYLADGAPIVGGDGYRLPTEAEWEYACRAGSKTPFSCGEQLSPDEANIDGSISYNGSAKGVNLGHTERVGRYKANDFGLYDMHGNVRELCWDFYQKDYYARSPIDDPRNASGPNCVVRGGSFTDHPVDCRSAKRRLGQVNFSLGFRVVRVRPD